MTTMRKILSLYLLVLIVFFAGKALAFGPPNYLPDGPHPRIWLTPSKLAQVQAKACVDGNGNPLTSCTQAPEWVQFIGAISKYTSGTYYGEDAFQFALAYAVTRNQNYLNQAISIAYADIANMSSFRDDNGLYAYQLVQDVALLYDWCYPVLTTQQQQDFRSYLVSSLNEIWNPAAPYYHWWAKEDPLDNYYWHQMNLTAFAATALYGDDSSIMTLVTNGVTYTTPMSFWNAKMTQVYQTFNQYNAEGGGWFEGICYGRSTFDSMFYSFLTMESATQMDYFSSWTFPTQMADFFLHAVQPDNFNFYPNGDVPGNTKGQLTPADRLDMQLLSEGAEGPAESQMAQFWTENIYPLPPSQSPDQWASEVLFRNTSRAALDPRTVMPLNYFAPGYGWFNWRTSWVDPNEISLSFDSTISIEGHQHRDRNSFSLFYRGWQVVDPNISDPTGEANSQPMGNTYDISGGQQFLHDQGTIMGGQVIAQEADAIHAYVKGDASNAYNDASNGYDDTENMILNYYYRSILTTGKYTVIYDRVSPKNTAATTTYYLHFINQPTVNGNTATATNGTGMMFHTTLYPTFTNISTGSDTKWATGSTGGYLKITPQVQLADNYLLNTIQTAPSGTSSAVVTSLIDGTALRGALVADSTENKVMMFSLTSLQITSGSYSATTTATSRHYVSDLQPSMGYNVSVDGGANAPYIASSAGVITFTASATGSHSYAIVLIPDTTPPVTTADHATGRYQHSFPLVVTCTDNVACSSTLYCLSLIGPCPPVQTYSTPLTTLLMNTAHQWACVSSVDTSSNTETPHCWKFDKQVKK